MATVGVWLELLDADGVPPERYEDCYRAEMQRRAALKSNGKDVPAMTADDLCARWREIKEMNAELDRTRLLPANAQAACQKCFGVMPHARYCDHVYGQSEEDVELQSNDPDVRAAAQARAAKMVQEGLQRIGSVRPEPAPVPLKANGVWLTCGDCGARAYTLAGVNIGDTCGALVKPEVESGPRPLRRCEGVMLLRGSKS